MDLNAMHYSIPPLFVFPFWIIVIKSLFGMLKTFSSIPTFIFMYQLLQFLSIKLPSFFLHAPFQPIISPTLCNLYTYMIYKNATLLIYDLEYRKSTSMIYAIRIPLFYNIQSILLLNKSKNITLWEKSTCKSFNEC